MNIYLAARYSRWPQMQSCRTELEALGHTVISRRLMSEGGWHVDTLRMFRCPRSVPGRGQPARSGCERRIQS